ncbi:MAG: hypothetical protein HYY13_00115 [Nitrospirae bacterium]|nr:hypothetical protein [Nitrospirota bacterium]
MPTLYFQLMHGDGPGTDLFMVQRTGVIWLFFSLCEGAAFARAERWPSLVAAVGLLRIMDVPADIVYLFTANSLTTLGAASLTTAPIFNGVVGILLLSAWRNRSRPVGSPPS